MSAKTHSRLAVKGEAIPVMGYDVHDPNFPFGRAAVVSVPDTSEGNEGGSRDMVLPQVVAPVIENLVAELTERDDRIKALEERLATRTDEATEPSAVPSPPIPVPLPRAPAVKALRLKSMLWRVLYGKEVQAVLSALGDEKYIIPRSSGQNRLLALAGFDLVYDEIAKVIISSRELIKTKINRDGFGAREVLLFIMHSIVGEELKVLNIHGPVEKLPPAGRQLFELWCYVCQALLDCGQMTAEEAETVHHRLERQAGIFS
ncbi:MAG: hypothetical protein WCF85_05400 [Rhodospirillaceae bacterium]